MYLAWRDPIPIHINPCFVFEDDPTPLRNKMVQFFFSEPLFLFLFWFLFCFVVFLELTKNDVGPQGKYLKTVSTCKHFDVHGGPENIPTNRLTFGKRKILFLYLFAFLSFFNFLYFLFLFLLFNFITFFFTILCHRCCCINKRLGHYVSTGFRSVC